MVTSHKFTITSITWSSTQYDKLITSSLEQVTWKEAHIPALWEKLMKDTGWLSALFHEVDWPAHKKAFTGLGRFCHLSTCKLIHDLILQRTSRNDTMANPVYALVGKKPETIAHLLTCPLEIAASFWKEAITTLTEKLTEISTPSQIFTAVTFGLPCLSETTPAIRPPKNPATHGSVHPLAMLANQCISHQEVLGWHQFTRGQISKYWRKFYCHFRPTSNPHWYTVGKTAHPGLMALYWFNMETQKWCSTEKRLYGAASPI